MAPNQSLPRMSPRKSYQRTQPSTSANQQRDASMDTAQKPDALASMFNAMLLLGLERDAATNDAGAPQNDKTPGDDQWAGDDDDDDQEDFEEVDYENTSYSSGAGYMAPNTGREMGPPAMPFTPQRGPSEASSSTMPQMASYESTTHGIGLTQHRPSAFPNRSLTAKAPMQTPPRASTSTNANPASKPALGRGFMEKKMLTTSIRKIPKNDALRPHTRQDQAMTSTLPPLDMSPTTPTRSAPSLSREASTTMLSPPGAETSIPSSTPTLRTPLKSILRPSRPLEREDALEDVTLQREEALPEAMPTEILPAQRQQRVWKKEWDPKPHQRTTDPRLRPTPAAKPSQQEIIADMTTPIPAQALDAVPFVVDDDSMRLPTPPPPAPPTADDLFANFENQGFDQFITKLLGPAKVAELEPIQTLGPLGNAFELKPTMSQRPLTPPMVSPPPVARAPIPLRPSVAPPAVACAPALQLNLGPAAEMDVSLTTVACAATTRSSTPPPVFLPVVAVATQPHLHAQPDLYTADDMDVDVDMVDDFAPSPTIVCQMDKPQLELAAVPEPEKLVMNGHLPIVAANVDAEAWYSQPAFPELGPESTARPCGFNPPHTEAPCLVFPQDPHPEPFCIPSLSMTMLGLPIADHVPVWLDTTLSCDGPSLIEAPSPPNVHVAPAEAAPSVPLVPAATHPRQPRPQEAWIREAIFRHEGGFSAYKSPLQRFRYRKHAPIASLNIYRTRIKPVGHAPPATERKVLFLPPPFEGQQNEAPSRRTKRARQDDDDDEKPRQKRMRQDDKAVNAKVPESVILKRARVDDEKQKLQPRGVDEVRRERKSSGLKRARAGNESQKLQPQGVDKVGRERKPKKQPARQVQQREVNDVQWGEPERVRFDKTMPGAFLPGCIDPVPMCNQAIDDAPTKSESTMLDPTVPGCFDSKPIHAQVLEPRPCAIPSIPLLPNCCRRPTQVEPQPFGFFQSTVSYFKKLWA